MSTANHPQTDGQSERSIRTIKDYLRVYLTDAGGSWENLLPLAEFAYNDSHHSATGASPFFLDGGHNPRSPIDLMIPREPDAPGKAFTRWRDALISARHALHLAHAKMSTPLSMPPHRYRPNDLVLLRHDHLRRSPPTLAPKWVGPYRVRSVPSPATVKLIIPDSRIHEVVNVDKVKPFVSPTPEFAPFSSDNLAVDKSSPLVRHDIVAIVRHSLHKDARKRHYLCRTSSGRTEWITMHGAIPAHILGPYLDVHAIRT